MAQIEIRPARADEAEKLFSLVMRSKQSNGYDDAFMELCREELRVEVDKLEAGEYQVAESIDANKMLMGCSALSGPDENNAAEVYALFVDPEHKRLGVGQALWSDLLDRAKSMGLSSIYLDADPEAVAFYQAQGMEIVGFNPSGSISGRQLPHMIYKL